jgi:hypothetical protein
MTKAREKQIYNIEELLALVSYEAERSYPDEVKQRLALARQNLASALSFLKVPA